MTTEPNATLPTIYIPHGGGPCFFMDWDPPHTWDRMAAWLRELGREFTDVKALLVVSAHWEEEVVTVQTGAQPDLYFDYYNFPPHTYELTWPAPGAPELAGRVRALLADAGIDSTENAERGFDHGCFVPLKVAFPDAHIPTLQLSLNTNLDPATHQALGRALAPLRKEGVLIIGSGMSFHNMAVLRGGVDGLEMSRRFDNWLEATCTADPKTRARALNQWDSAPEGRNSHPREEHLIPLMVAAGAADDEPGQIAFRDEVMGARVSAYRFGTR